MEKNNTSSNSSVCNKIRQALSNNPALRAIHRISSYPNPQEQPKHVTYDYSSSISSSSPSSSSPSSSSPIKTKVTKPQQFPQQHVKANPKESASSVPISFDYSSTSAHGQLAKIPKPYVPNSEISTTKVATQAELPQQHHHGHGHDHGVHIEQQGKKSLIDINDTFNDYIKRAKDKIRTVSNIGRGQNSNYASAQDYESHDANYKKKNDHKDQFSDFIHRAKKKFRTTTIVGKSSSLRKG